MSDPFPSTVWSEVRAAGGGAREALARLLERYWPTIYAYLRRTGRDRESARDLTQGFFTALLEDVEFFSRARIEHGRFRAFLLGALKNYVGSERRHDRALKRGGGAFTLSLDFDRAEERLKLAVVDDPSRAFDVQWALATLDAALAELRAELSPKVYASFRAATQAPGRTYAEVARSLGVTEQDVTNHVYRARRRLRELVIEKLRDGVDGPADLEAEIADLRRAVAR